MRPISPVNLFAGGLYKWWKRDPCFEGLCSVLVHYAVVNGLKKSDAVALAAGSASTWLFRSGNSCNVKKACHYIFCQLPGCQGRQNKLIEKGEDDKAPKWSPSSEEIQAGFKFLNLNVPLTNANNEQLEWITLQRLDKESPVFG